MISQACLVYKYNHHTHKSKLTFCFFVRPTAQNQNICLEPLNNWSLNQMNHKLDEKNTYKLKKYSPIKKIQITSVMSYFAILKAYF